MPSDSAVSRPLTPSFYGANESKATKHNGGNKEQDIYQKIRHPQPPPPSLRFHITRRHGGASGAEPGWYAPLGRIGLTDEEPGVRGGEAGGRRGLGRMR